MSLSLSSSKISSKTALKPGDTIRLNHFLAESGICSRRGADNLIKSGQISVNGEICIDLGSKIDPLKDVVTYKDKKVYPQKEKIYVMLNKPRGYLVTHSDEFNRKTIYDLLPDNAQNLRYAGRLDKDSEGLLLLTNDGELLNLLTHPSSKVEKVYKVKINKRLTKQELNTLRQGVQIEGGITHSAGVYVKNSSDNGMTLKIVLTEGKKREIRQMMEAVGAKVLRLRRVQFANLKLKDLPIGRWRYLTRAELKVLKDSVEKD
ncbi:MAG: pseudouridine synthase [Candidatus Cloacimonadaceae bacterium]|jgi:23S rRNA pseudouridine2605 synthase|nr:rRNA pseudouridine synthase [Candidatus Cloacimonadota bacterium]MDD5624631.1 pseudouridine synthase [Candidatus Cloacimonadota bacterium]MDY0112405.1 pseudouridine synthase [Candidatus Syntrophosphaera sp.]